MAREWKTDKTLLDAIRIGDLNNVKKILGKVKHIKELDDTFGFESLRVANECNHKNIIEYLLKADLDKDTVATTLHISAYHGDLTITKMLAEFIDINIKDCHNRTSLHYAAEMGKEEVVAYLLEQGATFDDKDRKNTTQLHLAAGSGNLNVVQLLILKGADVNAEEDFQKTPLHFAAERNCHKICDLLIRNGANCDAYDAYLQVPILFATLYGHVEVVKVMIAHKANLNQLARRNRTPLHCATENGHYQIVKLLCENGADIDFLDLAGMSALYLALFHRYNEFKKLLDNQMGNQIQYIELLDLVKNSRQEKCVNVLINSGAKVDCVDTGGFTPLAKFSNGHEMNATFLKYFAGFCLTSVIGVNPLELDFAKQQLPPFNDYFDEIQNMKKMFIGDSKITYFNILSAAIDEQKLSRYLENESVRKHLQNDVPKELKLFADCFKPLYEKGETRRKLITKASKKLVNIDNRLVFVADNVLNYLSNDELKLFLQN